MRSWNIWQKNIKNNDMTKVNKLTTFNEKETTFVSSETTLITKEGWLDWNLLSLDQMVEYLRNKYRFSSTGDAKCIYHLIEFYDKHKEQ